MNLPSIGELLLIFFILLLVFGAGKLPALGESLGRGIRNFKRGVTGEATAGKGSADAGKPNA